MNNFKKTIITHIKKDIKEFDRELKKINVLIYNINQKIFLGHLKINIPLASETKVNRKE